MLEAVLVFWPSFIFGILHTLMPCEDKAIFVFYSFGVSKDSKQAFKILNLYGSGLFSANVFIGFIVSVLAAVIGPYLQLYVDRFVWNLLSGVSLMVAGFIIIFAIVKNKYFPHSEQMQDIATGLSTLRQKKRTAFFLGILAGLPPCLFELAIYSYAISISLIYGWLNGVVAVMFFGIGTWVGLFPLAIAGTMGGKLSKFLTRMNIQRKQEMSTKENEEELTEEELKEETEKTETKIRSNLEIFSAAVLILL